MKTTNIVNIVLNDFTNDSRVLKICNSLSNNGFTVTVLALHNEGLKIKEYKNNIFINRLKLLSRSWYKYKLIQLLKYCEFIVRAVIFCRNKDILHCNDLSTLPVGILSKIFSKNTRVIYDCHEYQTEINGINWLEKKFKKILEFFLIRFTDEIITVSNSIANEYSRLYSIPKPYVILNCPVYNKQENKNLFRDVLPIHENQTIFLYQGGLCSGRGLEILLEGFDRLNTDNKVLVCMGYGPLANYVNEKARKSSTIFYFPAVSPSILLDYTASADFGILFYEDICLNHRYCSPNKIFEYLMAGIPVISSNLYEMKRLVMSEEVGIVADKNTVQGLMNAIEDSLLKDYYAIQQNVHRARKKYCWQEQEKVLRKIYNKYIYI